MPGLAEVLTSVTTFSNRALNEIYDTNLDDILEGRFQEPLSKENLRAFLKWRRCDEGLSFIEKVREFKGLLGDFVSRRSIVVEVEDKKTAIVDVLHDIDQRFFDSESMEQVNVSSSMRKKVVQDIANSIEAANIAKEDSSLDDVFDRKMFDQAEEEMVKLISMDHKRMFLKYASTSIISKKHQRFYLKLSIGSYFLAVGLLCAVFVLHPDELWYRLYALPLFFCWFNFFLIFYTHFCPIFVTLGAYEKPGQSLSFLNASKAAWNRSLWKVRHSNESLDNLISEPRLKIIHRQMTFVLFSKAFIYASIAMVIILFMPPHGLYERIPALDDFLDDLFNN